MTTKTTTETTARLAVLEESTTDFDHFTKRLAAYCTKYIMEIAKPIMERTAELYEEKAIVKLVDLWYEADRQYESKRKSYLVQWYTNKANGYGFEPMEAYKWVKDERRAYDQALNALLIR